MGPGNAKAGPGVCAGFWRDFDARTGLEIGKLDLGILALDEGGPVLAVEVADGGVEVQRGTLDGVELVTPVVHLIDGRKSRAPQEPGVLALEMGPVERVEKAVHGLAQQVPRRQGAD